jgi:DNA-binding response OmpR family regulator
VDDDVRVLELVARALRAEGFSADTTTDAEDAVRLSVEGGYNLVILDLRMPGLGGIGALREIIARRPEQQVLVLSCLGDVDSKVTCLNLGADDFVTKPFSLDELLARVRARLRSERQSAAANDVSGGSVTLGTDRLVLDPIRQEADAGFGPVALSRREFLLLRELVRNAGRTVSKERLLSSVWGYHHHPGSNVVDVYVRRIRAKLGADVVTTVRGEGYRVEVV